MKTSSPGIIRATVGPPHSPEVGFAGHRVPPAREHGLLIAWAFALPATR